MDLQVQDEAAAGLSPEAEREVYRAVVEALTNIRRHARAAQNVQIALRGVVGQVELTITDDALPPDDPGPTRTGQGLTSLSARIRALGGTVSAGPEPVCGWRLYVTLPVQEAGHGE